MLNALFKENHEYFQKISVSEGLFLIVDMQFGDIWGDFFDPKI